MRLERGDESNRQGDLGSCFADVTAGLQRVNRS